MLNTLIISQTMLSPKLFEMALAYRGINEKAFRKIRKPEEQALFDIARTGKGEQEVWGKVNEIYPKWQNLLMADEFTHHLLKEREKMCCSFANNLDFVAQQISDRQQIKKLQLKSAQFILDFFDLVSTSRVDNISPKLHFEHEERAKLASYWLPKEPFSCKKTFKANSLSHPYKGKFQVDLTPSLFDENTWGIAVKFDTQSLELRKTVEANLADALLKMESELEIKFTALGH